MEKTAEEILKLGEDYAKNIGNIDGTSCFDFVVGYRKCQEDMADKKYTEEDLKKAMNYASQITNNKIKYIEDYINSLNKQD